MKRNEFKLLIENWRKGVVFENELKDEGGYLESDKSLENELKEAEDEDIDAPFPGSEEPEDMSMMGGHPMDDDLMGDDLMGDEVMNSAMSGGDDERQQLLKRFCEMMDIECEESKIEEFLIGQAARAGYSHEGHSFDDMHDEEMH